MFDIIKVDPSCAEALEPLGAKRKFWFMDEQDHRVLFKAEDRGTGEDWAEKVACELCTLLGLPHVHYELAQETGSQTPGVICENIAPDPLLLDHGNELLLARDPNYPAQNDKKYKVRQHTVDAVHDILQTLKLPPPSFTNQLPGKIVTATDVFIGYVMLDVWIGNQDRHHQNWAALRIKDDLYLAPTFDHAASLARNLQDEEKDKRLNTDDKGYNIASFVCKARTAFYADTSAGQPMKTIEAWEAFTKFSPQASTTWLRKLQLINEDGIKNILAQVPSARLSATSGQFTLELLLENRRRLLKAGGL